MRLIGLIRQIGPNRPILYLDTRWGTAIIPPQYRDRAFLMRPPIGLELAEQAHWRFCPIGCRAVVRMEAPWLAPPLSWGS
jgi:hypothetical protein